MGNLLMINLSNYSHDQMSKGVKTPRNLLCEIGPLNGDREEKNTSFSGETSTTPFDAVYLKTDPFRRFF